MRYLLGIAFFVLLLAWSETSSAQQINEAPLNGLYENEGVINKKPIPYPSLRRADVMWQKRIWRVIDFREKMNQPFYYPLEPQGSWRSFIQIVLDAMKTGEITAYDITSTDEFLAPMSYWQVINRHTDTIHRTLQRPYPPYDQYDTTIYSAFDPALVMQLRIKEDWYFDKQRSQMMVRIIGLCPVIIREREGEEVPEPLFWIYFPEAREVFAKSQIYNRHNDAERRTYDEVFWKRMFSSTIFKESNVYDRRISEYLSGIDALFEAERIKKELFVFEQSLWEY